MRMRDLTMMIRWITHSCWLLAIFIQFCFDFIGIYSADDSIGFERTHIMRTAACASWSGRRVSSDSGGLSFTDDACVNIKKAPKAISFWMICGALARPAGFEPTVFRVGVEHSIH